MSDHPAGLATGVNLSIEARHRRIIDWLVDRIGREPAAMVPVTQ